MADSEVQVGGRLTPNSPPTKTPFLGQHEDKTSCWEADDTEQRGGVSPCSSGREEVSLKSIQFQFLFLIDKADDLRNHLVNWGSGLPFLRRIGAALAPYYGNMQIEDERLGRGGTDQIGCEAGRQGQSLEEKDFAALVLTFLNTCQPYFNYLESTARHQSVPLSSIISSKLLSFSQQLCNRLEQLVLTFANYNLLCLDESEPHSVSHFGIGQFQFGRAWLTVFLYPKPMPYLACVNTGWYKRMRWNVERLRDHGGDGESAEREEATDTEYYFLCYEDVLEVEETSEGACKKNVERMWTIGQWIQVNPDPNKEDIYDWILCEVPRAKFKRLLYLGNVEPSACSATNHLLELLSAQQTAGPDRPSEVSLCWVL